MQKAARFGAAAALIMAATGATAAYAASDDAPDGQGDASIVGVWAVTVTPADPSKPAFHSTIAFAPGGVAVEATGKPFVAPVTDTSEGLGVWHRGEDGLIHLTFMKYNYGANGAPIGTTTVVETDTLSDSGYTGRAVATVRSPSGTILQTLASTSSGVRMAR